MQYEMRKKIPGLRAKLNCLYYYPGSKIRSSKQLSEYLDVKESTISLYINGDERRPAGYVSGGALLKLARWLSDIVDGRISEKQAMGLWQEDFVRFLRALVPDLTWNFNRILSENPSRIDVRIAIQKMGAISAINGLLEIPTGTVIVAPNETVFFELGVSRGRSLVLLCEDEFGWQQLVPGRFHNGRVEAATERIPSFEATESTIKFEPPYQLERFVFIETETAQPILSSPNLRARLSSAELDQLCADLKNRELIPSWRWQEEYVKVHVSAVEANGPHGN